MSNSSISLHRMKPVDLESAVDQPPPPEYPPPKCCTVAGCIATFCILGLLLILGLGIFGVIWIANDGFSPFATFKVVSLSPMNTTSEVHWDITLRVGNPRSKRYNGRNVSYKVAHAYLSFSEETIAMGDIPAFDLLMEKNIMLNAKLNTLSSYPNDKLLHNHDNLFLNIVVPVSMADGPAEFYNTLTVMCSHFRCVTSSTTQEIQFHSGNCLTGWYPFGIK